MTSLDVRHKQRAEFEHLVLEGEPSINIFKSLGKVYGNAAMGYSAVKKWVSTIKDEQENPGLSDTQKPPHKVQNGLA